MPFLPPPGGNLDPELARSEQEAIEPTAEHYAQTHLPKEDVDRLGTRPQRLVNRLLERLSGRRG